MAIRYDLYQSPQQPGKEPGRVHARPHSEQTLSTDELLERISHESPNDKNDLRHALMRILDEMKIAIAQGYRVHLESLGYFSPQLTNLHVEDKRYKRPVIRATGLNFTCEKDVKQYFSGIETIYVPNLHRSIKGVDTSDLEDALRQHFESKPTITRKQFQDVYPDISRSSLCNYLRQLVEEGKLVNVGTKNSPVYMKGEKL